MPETPPEYIAFQKEQNMPGSIFKIAPEIPPAAWVVIPYEETGLRVCSFCGGRLMCQHCQ